MTVNVRQLLTEETPSVGSFREPASMEGAQYGTENDCAPSSLRSTP